jgi:hypothetical protein
VWLTLVPYIWMADFCDLYLDSWLLCPIHGWSTLVPYIWMATSCTLYLDAWLLCPIYGRLTLVPYIWMADSCALYLDGWLLCPISGRLPISGWCDLYIYISVDDFFSRPDIGSGFPVSWKPQLCPWPEAFSCTFFLPQVSYVFSFALKLTIFLSLI